jgi:hypothetical protein
VAGCEIAHKAKKRTIGDDNPVDVLLEGKAISVQQQDSQYDSTMQHHGSKTEPDDRSDTILQNEQDRWEVARDGDGDVAMGGVSPPAEQVGWADLRNQHLKRKATQESVENAREENGHKAKKPKVKHGGPDRKTCSSQGQAKPAGAPKRQLKRSQTKGSEDDTPGSNAGFQTKRRKISNDNQDNAPLTGEVQSRRSRPLKGLCRRPGWLFILRHSPEAYVHKILTLELQHTIDADWELFTDCLRRYDVVNRGFSGYNTSQALNIFEQLFPAPGPGTAKMEYLVSPSRSPGSAAKGDRPYWIDTVATTLIRSDLGGESRLVRLGGPYCIARRSLYSAQGDRAAPAGLLLLSS